MVCPRCGSDKVSIQVMTKSQIRRRKGGCLMNAFNIFLSILMIIPGLILYAFRLLIRIAKGPDVKETTHSVSVCQSCGNMWENY